MIDLGKRFPDRQLGSTYEPLEMQLVQYGVPIDLSGATLAFELASSDTGDALEAAGAASGAANGVASYQMSAADAWPVGLYRCQFVATWPDGAVLRSERVQLRILPNVT